MQDKEISMSFRMSTLLTIGVLTACSSGAKEDQANTLGAEPSGAPENLLAASDAPTQAAPLKADLMITSSLLARGINPDRDMDLNTRCVGQKISIGNTSGQRVTLGIRDLGLNNPSAVGQITDQTTLPYTFKRDGELVLFDASTKKALFSFPVIDCEESEADEAPPEKTSDECIGVAIKAAHAIGNNSSVLRPGQTIFEITQFWRDKATGQTSFCAHGDYCYPADAIKLTNCSIHGKIDEDDQAVFYSVE